MKGIEGVQNTTNGAIETRAGRRSRSSPEIPSRARNLDVSAIGGITLSRKLETKIRGLKKRGKSEEITQDIVDCFKALGFGVESSTPKAIRIVGIDTTGKKASAELSQIEAVDFLKAIVEISANKVASEKASVTVDIPDFRLGGNSIDPAIRAGIDSYMNESSVWSELPDTVINFIRAHGLDVTQRGSLLLVGGKTQNGAFADVRLRSTSDIRNFLKIIIASTEENVLDGDVSAIPSAEAIVTVTDALDEVTFDELDSETMAFVDTLKDITIVDDIVLDKVLSALRALGVGVEANGTEIIISKRLDMSREYKDTFAIDDAIRLLQQVVSVQREAMPEGETQQVENLPEVTIPDFVIDNHTAIKQELLVEVQNFLNSGASYTHAPDIIVRFLRDCGLNAACNYGKDDPLIVSGNTVFDMTTSVSLYKMSDVKELVQSLLHKLSPDGTPISGGMSDVLSAWSDEVGEGIDADPADVTPLPRVDQNGLRTPQENEPIRHQDISPESIAYIQSLTAEEINRMNILDGFSKELIIALEEIGYDVDRQTTARSVLSFTSHEDPSDQLRKIRPTEAVYLLRRYIEKYQSGVEKKNGDDPENSGKGFFDSRFESQFGITEEELRGVSGFELLSGPQQKLVFDNLKEYAERGRTPYIGWVWEGIKEGIGIHGDTVPVRGSKGMEAYGVVLTQLVKSLAEYGPKVHEENGELIPSFIDIDLQGKREHRPEIREAILNINRVAGILSKTPSSWQEDGIGTHIQNESRFVSMVKNRFSGNRKNYLTYKERQQAYDTAKENLSRVLVESGYSEGEVALKLVELDKQVFETQFIQTSPDAVEAITSIEDTGFWHTVGKSLTKKSNLAHMALGFVGRTASTGALGVFAAPFVSASLAGLKAFNTTEAELRERDRAARMGKGDTSEEALNIVSAKQQIEMGGVTYEVGVTKKLQDLIDKFQALPDNADQSDRNKLVASITARITYIEDKQKLNRINFGTDSNRPALFAKLYETLGMAHMIVAEYSEESANLKERFTVSGRLEKLQTSLTKNLSKRELEIHNQRRLLQAKKIGWSVLRAGSFSFAGGQLSEYVRGTEVMQKIFGGAGVGGGAQVASRVDEAVPQSVGAAAEASPEAPKASGAPSGDAHSPVATPEVVDEENAREEVRKQVSAMQKDIEALGGKEPYVIQKGDTLTKILKEHAPAISALGTTQAQENALTNIFKSLTTDEMDRIGITSHNVNLIRTGDSININELNAIIEEKKAIIESTKERGEDTLRTSPNEQPVTLKKVPTAPVFTGASDGLPVNGVGNPIVAQGEPAMIGTPRPGIVQEGPLGPVLPDEPTYQPTAMGETSVVIPEERPIRNVDVRGPIEEPVTPQMVAEFRGKFVEGRLSQNEWAMLRNEPITNLKTPRILLTNDARGVSIRKLEYLKVLFQENYKIIPKQNETVEGYLVRSARVIEKLTSGSTFEAQKFGRYMDGYNTYVRVLNTAVQNTNEPLPSNVPNVGEPRRYEFGQDREIPPITISSQERNIWGGTQDPRADRYPNRPQDGPRVPRERLPNGDQYPNNGEPRRVNFGGRNRDGTIFAGERSGDTIFGSDQDFRAGDRPWRRP